MGRPKLDITRCRQLNIGLTDNEYDTVLRAAQAHGMRPVDFARMKLLAQQARRRDAGAALRAGFDPLSLSRLSRIGNNLNQIARQLYVLQLPTPDDLAPALAELRAVLRGFGP